MCVKKNDKIPALRMQKGQRQRYFGKRGGRGNWDQKEKVCKGIPLCCDWQMLD